ISAQFRLLARFKTDRLPRGRFESGVRVRRMRKLPFRAFRTERQVTCTLLPEFDRTLEVGFG
ncbi:MAG TPA: hypothetical protein PLF25_12220, partial [Accumulibacter sp.]|nr:hypothetical protein [Accumulibacter sp.]